MEFNKNRLALGTVQFGLDYGINNKKGKPLKEKVLEMLEKAYENGINIFDTASAYGDAEEILGEFISKNNLQEDILIISKLKPNIIEENCDNVLEIVESEIKKSLEKLKIKSLYGYLLHTPEYIYNDQIVSALKICKERGLIENWGVSIYEEKDALYAANLAVDFIQIPYNIFDQRLDKTKFFETAKKNNIIVFARSAFLQGLLFMEERDIPIYLVEARQYIKDFNEIIKKYSLTKAQAALLFSYSNKNIDYIVFGVDNLEQLKEDLRIIEENMNCRECVEELKNKFLNVPRSIIFPSLWKKERKTEEKKKILAIIQARTGSSRLPGKMLKQINDKPLIWYIINAAKKSKLINEIVLATTDKEEDKILLEKSKEYGIERFAGSENDVLDRFYQCSKKYNGEIIVRLTGDCPLHDPEIIDKTIELFLKNKVDYVSNSHPPTFPDGLDVEVFSFESLEKSWKEAKQLSQREHVTSYFRDNKNLFRLANLEHNRDLSHLRWTVDEERDFEFIRAIIEKLNNLPIGMNNVLEVLKIFPDLQKINENILRNEGYLKSLKKDMDLKFKESKRLLEEAKKIIPTASQTYSKSSRYFCEGAGPAFLSRGEGGKVWDVDGNEYLDFVCGLGAITLGYNIPEINKKIEEQLKKGASFTLPTELEIKLANKLIKIIPCAEMVKFVKNGSDATTGAIRLARAHTGREVVALCGYHGFHDWSIGVTENNLGVPKTVQELTKVFKYNDLESLKQIFRENPEKIAAVILEPCQGNGPENNFLEEVRELVHANGAVLIFDEVVSGFRMGLGGAQEYYKVIPDLSSFGKGMGNGVSISAIVGKKEILQLIDRGVFISLTFGGETIGLVSALATIEILEKPESFKHIWRLGEKWKKQVSELIQKKEMTNSVEVIGEAPHCGLIFKQTGKLTRDDLFSVYQQTLIEKGILSLGINNFCLAHDEKDIDNFVFAVELALEKVKEVIKLDSVEGLLVGKKFQPVFRR